MRTASEQAASRRAPRWIGLGVVFISLGSLFAAGPQIDALVITERFDGEFAATAPTAGGATFALYDGGYVEAGNVNAGDRAPQPDAVVAAVGEALSKAGFSAVPADLASLAVIIHWGVVQPDNLPRRFFRMDSNLRTRLALVGTASIAGRLENYVMKNMPGHVKDPDYETPQVIVGGPLELAIQRARGGHYFLAISAYAPEALRRGEARLVWRTILSTRSIGAWCDEAIAQFAATAASYVGRDSEEVTELRLPLLAQPRSSTVPAREVPEDRFLQQVIAAERTKFSGEELDQETAALVKGRKPRAERWAETSAH